MNSFKIKTATLLGKGIGLFVFVTIAIPLIIIAIILFIVFATPVGLLLASYILTLMLMYSEATAWFALIIIVTVISIAYCRYYSDHSE